jgi:hypothetical protein
MSFGSALKFVGTQSAQSIVGTVSLAFGFMLFNDYVAPPPDLSGRWKFTVNYDDTELTRFKNMQVTYQALLVQEDLTLSGLGEKMSAVGPTVARENYLPKDRVNVEFSGYVKNNFFSPDEFVLQYKEGGAVRDSATLHNVVLNSDGSGCGCFQSTIAGTRGLVQWRRLIATDVASDPIEKSAICPSRPCR